jgi:hypothetical protein
LFAKGKFKPTGWIHLNYVGWGSSGVGWTFNALHRPKGRYSNLNRIAWVIGAEFLK